MKTFPYIGFNIKFVFWLWPSWIFIRRFFFVYKFYGIIQKLFVYHFGSIIFLVSEKKKIFICPYGLMFTLSFDGGYQQQKHINFLEDNIRNIPTKEHFHHTCCFQEEYFWNFSQSEIIIGASSHIEFLNKTKSCKMLKTTHSNYPRFDSNWSSSL